AMNFIEGVIQRSGDSGKGAGMCVFKGIDLTLDVPCDGEARGRVFLGVRPQHIEVSADGENRPKAEVGVVEPMGNELIVYVTLSGGDKLVAVAPPQDPIKPGDIVSIRVRPEGVHIFDADSGKRIDAAPQRL
ncbi:MAG: TOBE domain-containing protein, partial [Gemmatimonadaceae bacterium]